MSTPLKDNEHIRADGKAFMDAYARARATFGRITGVMGVGYGVKERAGVFGSDIAILVYVSAKHPENSLPPERRIPTEFEGYRTDVRVFISSRPAVAICDDNTKHDKITGGIQIEAGPRPYDPLATKVTSAAGTLGCIVKKRGDSGETNLYVLTNHHVVMAEGADPHPTFGDGVYHPYWNRTGLVKTKGTLLGTIERRLARNGHVDADGSPVINEPKVTPFSDETSIDSFFEGFFVDCAAIRLYPDTSCCDSLCTRSDIVVDTTIQSLNLPLTPPVGGTTADIDRITDVRDLRSEGALSVADARVFKIGAKTGRTAGKIVGVNVPGHEFITTISGKHLKKFAYHVVEIVLDPPGLNLCARNESTDPANNAFGWHGDSGSLIVDERNRAVALLYAGTEKENEAGVYLTRACFIVPVLDFLGMCIPTTTGTSHGSSKATDGSGLTKHAGLLPPDEDRVLFTSGAVAAPARPRRAPSPETVPLADDQRARMLRLLDEFRETERNRRLHESFLEVRREITYLVRHCRPVTLTWHRHRGPAFLACVINHLKGDAASVPLQIGGVTRGELLARMSAALYQNGSNPLRAAIDRHRDELTLILPAATAQECIEILRRADAVEVAE